MPQCPSHWGHLVQTPVSVINYKIWNGCDHINLQWWKPACLKAVSVILISPTTSTATKRGCHGELSFSSLNSIYAFSFYISDLVIWSESGNLHWRSQGVGLVAITNVLIIENPEAEPRWTHLGLIPLWKQRFGDRARCGASLTAKKLGRTLGLQKFGTAFFSVVIIQRAKIDTLSYCHSFPPVGEAVLATGWLRRVETRAVEQCRLKVQLSTFTMAGLTLSLRMPHLYLLFRVIICPTRVFVKVQIFK